MDSRFSWAVRILAVITVALTPGALSAQEAATDSLKAQIGALEARIDSLVAELNRQGAEADSAEVEDAEDELAALRRAAREAAAADSTGAEADTAAAIQQSRSGDLSAFNPEISVTGDLVGGVAAPADGGSEFQAVPREFEFSFQAQLDPYARAKVFVSYEQEVEIAGLEEPVPIGDAEDPPEEEEEGGSPFDLEEGYLFWLGLPANFGLKAGLFRQEIGLFNRWHTHALPQVTRPLPAVAFFGDDGLIQTGVSITMPTFGIGPAYQTLWFELTAGTNDIMFGNSTNPAFLGRFQSFFDISPSTYLQVGVTGVTGRNQFSRQSSVASVDVIFRWSPPARQLYQELFVKGEWYWAKRELSVSDQTGNGGSAQASYKLSRRWVVGTRVDYLDNYGSDPDILQLVPTIDWWQSEYVRIRLQYNYVKPDGEGGNHTFLLQTVFAVGPHRHEAY